MPESADDARYIPIRDWNRAVEDARRGAGRDAPGWVVNSGNVISQLATEHTAAAAFSSLHFSDAVNRAISAAMDVELPEQPVAIHLRAGDLVFGWYRSTPRWRSKVIPIPVAEDIVRQFHAAGRSVVVFNQEESGGRYLQSRYPVALVSQVREEVLGSSDVSEAAQAFFDMALMSRCETIVGGSSAFIRIAASIGGIQIRPPDRLLSRQRQLEVVLREKDSFANQYHPLYAAYASCSAAEVAEGEKQSRQANDLLIAAARLDPGNHLYRLKIGINLCRLGDAAAGERVFGDLLEEEFSRRALLPTPSLGFLRDFKGVLSRTLDPILEAAKSGPFPYASILAALVHLDQGRADAALAEARKAAQLLSGNQLAEQARQRFERSAATMPSATA